MSQQQKYDYRMSWVDDNRLEVDKHMKEWADAGWELVSGTGMSYEVSSGVAGTIHIRYIMYWRQPTVESAD